MRLLALSSFYPPHHLGGYELAAASAIDGLRARGHDIHVLTTTFRTDHGEGDPEPADVARALHLYWQDGAWKRPGLNGTIASTRQDLTAFGNAVDRVKPDAVWAWHLAGVSKSLLVRAAQLRVPVILVLHDLWPLYDRTDPWLRWTRGLRMPMGLAVARRTGLPRRGADLRTLAGASYNSAWTRDQLFGRGRTPDGPVIHPAVDLSRFTPGPPPAAVRRFLHLGRIEPRKGPMVAVRGLAEARAAGLAGATLTLAGPSEAGHVDQVLELASRLGVDDAVRYAGVIERGAVPALYRDHHAVIHSATWEEPFGLVLVEAMATGRPVIASPTGGSLEIARDGDNALTFAKGDSAGLARRMLELAGDATLAARLAAAGARTAAGYSADAATDAHEAHLQETLNRA